MIYVILVVLALVAAFILGKTYGAEAEADAIALALRARANGSAIYRSAVERIKGEESALLKRLRSKL